MTTFKKIISLLLVVCMLATVFSLTACGKKNTGNNDEENKNETPNENGGNENVSTDKTYTVTVVDGDKNPIEGVKLVITDGKAFPTVTTDKDGKASTELPDGTVSIMVTSTPDGYLKPEKVSGIYHGVFAKDSTEFTLTLEKEASDKVTYTVKVVDQNGNAVVGMGIQLCPGGVCLPDNFVTNADGEITKDLAPNAEVHVKLEGLSGYTLPATLDGTYHAVIESGETEITVAVTKN